MFYKQILSGDPGDGYQGLKGIGPVKAEQILARYDREVWWSSIVEEYIDRGLTEKDALQQARVARICRLVCEIYT